MRETLLKLARGREAWEPGGTLEGNIRLGHEHAWTADYVELVVWWSTTGKGDQDKGIVHRETFVQKGGQVPASMERSFRVRLPKGPWTYHGRLIKIDWYVALYARERGQPEDSVMIPIRVFPGGSAEPVAPGRDFLPDDAPPEE